jgi:hypothetical protein
VKVRHLVAWIGLPLAFVAAGIASNRTSEVPCMRNTAVVLAAQAKTEQFGPQLRVAPIFGVQDIFRSAGFVIVEGAEVQEVYFQRPVTVLPWIVDVDWGMNKAAFDAHGGSRRFLCLFGFVLPVSDRSTWVS